MKMILSLLIALMILVTVTTISHAKGPKSPGYQCKHIGKQKVKPFKFTKAMVQKAKEHTIAVVAHPKFRAYGYDY